MNVPTKFFDDLKLQATIGTSEPLRAAMSPEQQLALQERYARLEYRKALLAAKAELAGVKIEKDRAGYGYKYADLSSALKAISPILNKHNLDVSFRTSQTDTKVSVTCVIFHVEGHSEETTLSAPPDTGAGKNVVQSIGSTVTYLSRYTLFPMLGLAASNDDDGRGGPDEGNGGITVEQAKQLRAALLGANIGEDRLLRFYGIKHLKELPAAKFDEALAHIANIKRKSNGTA